VCTMCFFLLYGLCRHELLVVVQLTVDLVSTNM
jgi:hypothetical protein